jgi:hypothetical protein
MKKKVISIPIELVNEMSKRITTSYSGNIIQGFVFCLNKNIQILKEQGIVLDKVDELTINAQGMIEHGFFSEDIIKNAVIRTTHQGKKKLIKALIIAAFNEQWMDVYCRYYDKNGELLSNVSGSNDRKETTSHNFVKTLKLKSWNTASNRSTPQWANYLKIPI